MLNDAVRLLMKDFILIFIVMLITSPIWIWVLTKISILLHWLVYLICIPVYNRVMRRYEK
jgi:hypothetical protein